MRSTRSKMRPKKTEAEETSSNSHEEDMQVDSEHSDQAQSSEQDDKEVPVRY